MPPTPDIPDFTFGVELEVTMPRGNSGDEGARNLARLLTENGVDCQAEGYNHLTRPHWKIVTDASIGYQNREIVSSVLRGEDGLEETRKVCGLLQQFGCGVDQQCGMHVHVGMRDRFHERIGVFKEVLRTYHKYESILDQLMAPSRRAQRNAYCGSVRWNEIIERAANVEDLRNAYGDRAKVNFAGAYWRHGTVEFRHHQGTVNGEKATKWIALCLRLVAHAARNTERSRPSERRPTVLPRPLVQCDLSRGTPVRGDDIPRFVNANSLTLRDLVITEVRPIQLTTRRNVESEGYANYRHNDTGRDLWTYHRAGGRRTHLAWDVDHGYVRVVRRSQCPEVAPEPSPEAQVTASQVSPTFTRPPTDEAPLTLEGLFELLQLSDAERQYFTERQLELNP